MSPISAEELLRDHQLLHLFVAGQSQHSLRAVANVQRICAEDLHGHYQLEVIDLYQQPHLAQGEQIIALPALIRKLPVPKRMVIGDMSNTERVIVGLNLTAPPCLPSAPG
jgi:circadian clock protein KaiB